MNAIGRFLIICAAVGCVLALAHTTCAAEGDSPIFLEVRLFEGNNTNPSEPNALGRCFVSSGRVCNGSYISNGTSSSISIGGEPILATQLETTFELLFSFTSEVYRDSTVLVGNVYSMNLSNGSISSGSKKTLRHAVQFNQPYDLVFKPATGASPIRLQYRLMTDGGQEEVAFGSNTITLKSLCQTPTATHKFSSTADLRKKQGKNALFGAVSDPIAFTAWFTTGDDSAETVEYKVQIEFDPPLGSQGDVSRTTMTLRRQYMFEGRGNNGVVSYSYNKPIEVVKGKMLKLVFPPDDIAPHSFTISDTIVINP